jgi:hypothetical protein
VGFKDKAPLLRWTPMRHQVTSIAPPQGRQLASSGGEMDPAQSPGDEFVVMR